MVVTFCSLFRNAMSYVDRYIAQVSNENPLKDTRWVFVEGDSTDNTYGRLSRWASGPYRANVQVIKKDQGTPRFGSVVSAERFRALSEIANLALEAVPPCDYVVWLESDLIVPHGTIKRLTDISGDEHTVAPYVLHTDKVTFYDVWAFRKDGNMFSPRPPYAGQEYTEPFEITSAGSLLVIPYRYIKEARFTKEEAIVGLCRNLRKLNCQIKVVPNVRIYHP